MLGSEGVGLYQMVYSTYCLLLTIVTGGHPTVLALTTAGNPGRGLRNFWLSFLFLVPVVGLISVLTHVNADRLALIFDEPRMGTAFLYLSPVLVIVPFLSLIRGFLQGIELYGIISLSELLEQTIRVVVMYVFISVWINESVHRAVGGALVGAWAGALAALLLLAVVMVKRVRSMHGRELDPLRARSVNEVIRYLNSSFSIMATRLIIPLADFLDAIVIPHRLQASGLGLAQATAVYGNFAGMAASLVYLPSLVTASLSHIAASKLSSDWQNQRFTTFRVRVHKMLTIGWYWGLGSTFYLYYYHRELAQLVFQNEEAALAIALMCIGPLIVGLRELSTTILWVMQKNQHTIYGLVAGMICAVTAGYFLIPIPEFRYIATALELLLLEMIAVIWNLIVLSKSQKPRIHYRSFFVNSLLLLGAGFLCCTCLEWLVDGLKLSSMISSVVTMMISFCLITAIVIMMAMKKHV